MSKATKEPTRDELAEGLAEIAAAKKTCKRTLAALTKMEKGTKALLKMHGAAPTRKRRARRRTFSERHPNAPPLAAER